MYELEPTAALYILPHNTPTAPKWWKALHNGGSTDLQQLPGALLQPWWHQALQERQL
jgi:hypothetical protein